MSSLQGEWENFRGKPKIDEVAQLITLEEDPERRVEGGKNLKKHPEESETTPAASSKGNT